LDSAYGNGSGEDDEPASNGYGRIDAITTITTIWSTVTTLTYTLVASHTTALTTYTGEVSFKVVTTAGQIQASTTIGVTVTDILLVTNTTAGPSTTKSLINPSSSSISRSSSSPGGDPTHHITTATTTTSESTQTQSASTDSSAGVAPTAIRKAMVMLAGVAGAMIIVF
jgi:hypothetical protein